jgi:5'-nucleotidase
MGGINNVSGTVNAALVAANRGVPAIAASATVPAAYKPYDALAAGDPEYEDAAIVLRIVKELVDQKATAGGALLPPGVALNVNIPTFTTGGGAALPLKVTREGVVGPVTPYFVNDLGADPNATALAPALGSVHLPGVSDALSPGSLPAGSSQYAEAETNTETAGAAAGAVTLSVLAGNHQAKRAPEAAVRAKLARIAY